MSALGTTLAVCVLAMATQARPQQAVADDVLLRDGKLLTGRVIYEDGEVVVLRDGSRDREIPRADVASVRSRLTALHHLLDELDGVAAADEEPLLTLARRAAASGLPDEARLLHLWTLCTHPDSAPANEALGNSKEHGVWRYRHERTWLPVRQLPDLQGDWSRRWTLRTLHYELQADIPLPAAIGCALDLERAHRAFFGVFAGKLRLLDVDELMPVQVHAERASYPEPGNDRLGYFDPDTATLFVLAGGPYNRTLVHESVHQLLSFVTDRTARSSGSIPGWLDEGLAQYIEAHILPGPIGSRLLVGLPDETKFFEHALSKDPYELKRLLTMDSGDFMASSNAFLKYCQSYTLVHYLLHGGEDGRALPGFGRFAQRAWDGQSSMSDFKKAIDMPLDDFEAAWSAYVRRTVGAGG